MKAFISHAQLRGHFKDFAERICIISRLGFSVGQYIHPTSSSMLRILSLSSSVVLVLFCRSSFREAMTDSLSAHSVPALASSLDAFVKWSSSS